MQKLFGISSISESVGEFSRSKEMDRWVKKIAVVTGASAGIGAAIAKDLAKTGMIVVGLARRVEKVEKLKNDLPEDMRQNLHSANCDVMKEEEIIKTFAWIDEKFGGVDVLINNAGILIPSVRLIDEGNSATILNTVNTNLIGLIFCTREAFKSMKKRSFAGHIVHISSLVGHIVPNMQATFDDYNFNVYCATKHAVKALTEGHRQELLKEKLGIKVSSVSPAVVQTDIMDCYSEEALKTIPHLKAEDISAAVLYALGTPPHVQIQDIVIKPVGSFI
ncbi:farnesol dehydrogenase-like [Phlebotomus argentipes]|uniref:farnesol dehydrogenase-like n=1 Tax=Phlebotomus argentipes TaxID=94469 RepID=UPI00289370F7|nr:farnesol dehydrogenase-like [Phlebotomus argentipes]